MLSKKGGDKGILAKLLETCIKILLKKECKKIGTLKIEISASSIQIIKGIIERIIIIAEEINYKDLLFDKIEIEAWKVRIILKINKKELKIENNSEIQFKILLSENSLKTILLSKNWEWIGNMITKKILNQEKLNDIKIKNNQIFIQSLKGINVKNGEERIDIKAKKGKIYLENQTYKKSIEIPIEDKIFIENIYLKNNLIFVSAKSTISF